MKFELEESLRGAPDEDLLADIRRSAEAIGRDTITMAEYEETGKAHPCTIQRRFGSWFAALTLAGLRPSRSRIGISDEELFENIRALWTSLGRQPRYGEVRLLGSQFSVSTYEKRYGSWSKALKAFVVWINSDPSDLSERDAASDRDAVATPSQLTSSKRRTRREISTRQRFRIMKRDDFKCQTCGASPSNTPGVELHVDHLLPWSKGGETTDDNLQTKCKQCNLGKGNVFDV